MVNTHILVIYTCKNFWYCFIFYELLRLPFWLKSSLMQHFLAFPSQRRFCVNEYIAKNLYKNLLSSFFGRFDVHLHVIQPILNRVPTRQGKVRDIWFFFKVREKSGNSVKWSGKLENLQKSGKSQGILRSCLVSPSKIKQTNMR